jgi:hypothetical protein
MPGRFLSDLSSLGAMAKEPLIQGVARYSAAASIRTRSRSSPRLKYATDSIVLGSAGKGIPIALVAANGKRARQTAQFV